MGLEIVELIMRVEEDFGIEIGDEEASQTSTVGELCQLVTLKLRVEPSPGCLSSAAFYQLRRDLREMTGLEKRKIAPQTAMTEIFPVSTRREWWEKLRAQSGAELPDLKLPIWLSGAIFGSWMALYLALGITTFGYSGDRIYAILIALGYLWLAFKVTKPLATCFPKVCETVGGVTHLATISRFKASPVAPANASVEEIWLAVQILVADQLSIPIEKVTRDADFVRDLGVG